MTKAIIFGAGSIGCFNGLAWRAHGLNVGFIGRATTGEVLQTRGGTIEGPFAETHVAPAEIDFNTEPSALKNADLIFLAVKATALSSVAADILQHANRDAIVVPLQNGIGNGDRLRALLLGFTVIEGMVPFNVVQTKPGYWRKTTNGNVCLGRHPKLESFFAPLGNTPFAIHFYDDMRAVTWSKLLLNLNNALNALSGETLHAQLSNRQWRELFAAAQDEALAVMKAEAIAPVRLTPLPPTLIPAFIRLPNWFFNTIGLRLQGVDRQARSSMSDDFTAGRPSEIDYLNGAILSHASRHAISCPVNETIVRLVKNAENGGQRVWRAEDVLAQVHQSKH